MAPATPQDRRAPLARPRYHLATSLGLAAALWRLTGKRRAAAAPLVSGFLIDFDHFLDYALIRSRIGGRAMVLPLHGWEYVPMWLALDRWLGTRGGLTAGYVVHLSIDQVWNEKRSAWAYFLMWRARKRFSSDQLGPVDPSARHRWRNASPLGLLRWF